MNKHQVVFDREPDVSKCRLYSLEIKKSDGWVEKQNLTRLKRKTVSWKIRHGAKSLEHGTGTREDIWH